MKPTKSQQNEPQDELFKNKLWQMIDHKHPLVQMAEVVSWARMEETFGTTYSEENGRPAISTRLMVALHYLKYTFDLSDDDVVMGWVENPYWQYFSGMKYFEHEIPIDPSSMTRWRKRVGEAGAEELLRETIESGLKMKAVKPFQFERLNVDTTVQEKNVRFPTDARLYDRARERLVAEAEARGIELRQSYRRNSKHLLLQQNRYAHAKQYRRARKCTKKLRTYLGRVIRDIERKFPQQDAQLSELLAVSRRIQEQTKNDSGKTYSVHAPEVECISKGKAHKRYEFGCKVSVAVTSRGGWFVGACAVHGNPYDGHTLAGAMNQVSRVMGRTPDEVFVDRGYRGHDYEGPAQIHVDRVRRGNIPNSVWRWMKRRAAVEPSIGHLKHGHRMDRNRLKGQEGDMLNAILSAVGMNFSKLLKHAAAFLRSIFIELLCQFFPFKMTNPNNLQASMRA